MKVGDKVSITTPWWAEPHEGEIVKIFATPQENYYVVEFDGGEMYTAKESEIPREERMNLNIQHILTRDETNDFKLGYLSAMYIHDVITEEEYNKYYNALVKEKKE